MKKILKANSIRPVLFASAPLPALNCCQVGFVIMMSIGSRLKMRVNEHKCQGSQPTTLTKDESGAKRD